MASSTQNPQPGPPASLVTTRGGAGYGCGPAAEKPRAATCSAAAPLLQSRAVRSPGWLLRDVTFATLNETLRQQVSLGHPTEAQLPEVGLAALGRALPPSVYTLLEPEARPSWGLKWMLPQAE